MEKWKAAPAPLKKKILLMALVGVGCLLVGIVLCVFSKDTMMLFLSLGVFGFSVYKAFSIYRLIAKNEYEVVEGTCVGIVPKMLGRYRKIKIMDDEANESTLLLDKQSKIKIGDRYRFYFKKTTRVTLGNEYFDTALASDCFLGYEAVEAFNSEQIE